ncbi:GAP family protein [Auraticoccus monumenti]|uniref:Sap, sulfolipid-1-addressing protein n=1 Tax=Auraticoccus monumenti TaxID=675864 RepID=A0A1G6TP70_9ACTN|nr:GAP family protein [Auraticoccus monumenti]SDD30829.1 Sap, sulfolipid-1-addressing protein [Auraticoccus monumenti]
MDLLGLGVLAGLALVDSTSIGTLVVPVVLLLRPRVHPGLVLLYLATIAVFYLAVGLLLMAGATTLLPRLGAALETPAAYAVQLALGVGLVVLAFRIEPRAAARRRERRGLPPTGEPRWQRRIEAAADRPGTMVGLALGAGLAEAATMLPYLGAIALLVGSGLGAWTSSGLLGGYVLVMVLPALVLLVLRLAGGRRWDPAMQRLRDWIARHSAGTLSWVVGILGVLLARDAVPHLAPLLDRLG